MRAINHLFRTSANPVPFGYFLAAVIGGLGSVLVQSPDTISNKPIRVNRVNVLISLIALVID
ncbi:hypothetical protein [Thermomonas sp. LB-4]|uniref:hypothetical protein n=1 Tax=Thermomonas sp. LB-4 TaxID=3102790 RepID=UPI002EDB76A0